MAAPAHASPVAVSTAQTLTVPKTVLFVHYPVTIWYQVWDGHTFLLCKETDSGNPHLGTALTCQVYDLAIAGEAQRLVGDFQAWVIAALQ